MVSKITTPITPLEQTEKINEIIDNLGIGGFNILEHKWSDHIINDISWLRADTFSWQSGAVYVAAYNHLVSDYNGGTSQTETVGSYTITYVLADDGHKITTDESTVASIYAESGVAWYYVLDTTNTRFKLPRVNPAREELIQVVRAKGNSIALGLMERENVFGGVEVTSNGTMRSNMGAYGKSIGSTYSGTTMTSTTLGITTDSTKSGIISDMTESTSVYKGHKYLYFYVGNYERSAVEQTAGLNSELFNGKVDLNAANLSTAGKSLISGLGMPSGRYIDLTLGAAFSTYTAPANGYFTLIKVPNGNNQYVSLYCLKDGETTLSVGSHEYCVNGWGVNGGGVNLLLPIKKGRICAVDYNAGGATEYFRFVYAEGEPNV